MMNYFFELFLEFKNLLRTNVHGQMISDLVGTDVQCWRNVLQPVVSGLAAGVFLKDIVVAGLEVIARFIHANHDVVHAHEESQQNVETRRHHTLKANLLAKN